MRVDEMVTTDINKMGEIPNRNMAYYSKCKTTALKFTQETYVPSSHPERA